MKILHVFKTYLPESIGGTQRFINQLAKGTKKYGIDAEVLTLSEYSDPQTITVDGHLVHRAKTLVDRASTPISMSAFSLFAKLASTADLIHYHHPYPFVDLLHFYVRPKVPTLVTYHSDIVRQKNLLKIYQPLERRFLRSVDRIVATSDNYVKTSNVLQEHKNKVDVIPIGIDEKMYPTPSAELCREVKEKYGNKFLLFVGVLRYYKGLEVLIRAVANTEYVVVIAGTGPEERKLHALATELGGGNIKFTGFVSEQERSALYLLCYAVVFPSVLRSEAFGISLLEGAMHTKPMIATEIGTGTSFVNLDGVTGICTEPNNPAVLRDAIEKLWTDEQLAAKMGLEARLRYEKIFTAECMCALYKKLYLNMASV